MDETLPPGVFRAQQFIRRFHATYLEIDLAAHDGTIDRLRHGWYATKGADPRVVAAVRAGGIAGCMTALSIHGIWLPPELHDEVHTRKSKHGETFGVRRCHGFGRVPATPDAVDDLPTALACAARCLTEELWIAAVDSALNQQLITIAELEAAWGSTPAWVRARLDKCDGRAQSGTESLVRVRLRALNFHVHVQPYVPGVGWVDLVAGRLIIECDSEQYHGPRPLRRNDYRRDRAALIGRWPTIRVDSTDVLHRWPQVLADIRAIAATDLHRRRRRPRHLASDHPSDDHNPDAENRPNSV